MGTWILPQSDGTLYVDKRTEEAEDICRLLDGFARKLRTGGTLETYRIDRFSLWEAAARGLTSGDVLNVLERYAKLPPPEPLIRLIRESMENFGNILLLPAEGESDRFLLVSRKEGWLDKLVSHPRLEGQAKRTERGLLIPNRWRGEVKRICLELGAPALDRIGTEDGRPLSVRLATGNHFPGLREYQREAAEAFCDPRRCPSAGGVIVLPCGAGKTVTALAVMAKLGRETLILTPGSTSSKQWIREILQKTSLTEDEVGEYSSERKEIRPLTVTTYQMMTYRDRDGTFPHMSLFMKRDWGLIIYDEVHLLPAPVFRATSQIQGKRRLGLTATLVREDGREGDVFTLIGPRIMEASWKEMERDGWIAEAELNEVRVPMDASLRERYLKAGKREQFRLAAENPRKLEAVRKLLRKHEDDQVLIIGQYLDQLEHLSETLGIPVITGRTPRERREECYRLFREKAIKVLAVSRIANMAVDLPGAGVAIQVSGTFGSRQEEAQRLGRILRPVPGGRKARFYHLVSEDSVELDFAWKRQSWLRERGYDYRVTSVEECEER
ncbi:DNA repair helicase XPB [Staphylospora marina]|uniref:DNA repair helicase XPB n=1 Tax=Staphylospora marina TaxID=2490858 RepID=UPI000F5BC15C|nr:DNA repair helicase XPB [Staphylospora marina]